MNGLISHWPVLFPPQRCVAPRPRTPAVCRSERTVATTLIEDSLIWTLKTPLGTESRPTSQALSPCRWHLLTAPPWGRSESWRRRARRARSLRSTPAAPPRGQTWPLNPNCGPWLRSPHLRTKAKDVVTRYRVGGRGGSGTRSPTAPPCPDTSIIRRPSSQDTPATGLWGPFTAAAARP